MKYLMARLRAAAWWAAWLATGAVLAVADTVSRARRVVNA